jgi:hypothetical protein
MGLGRQIGFNPKHLETAPDATFFSDNASYVDAGSVYLLTVPSRAVFA